MGSFYFLNIYILEQLKVHRKIDPKAVFHKTPAPPTTHMHSLPHYQHRSQERYIGYNWTYINSLPAKVHSLHCSSLLYRSVFCIFKIFSLNMLTFAFTPFLFLDFRTMCAQYCISFADVEKAHINIRDFIHLTPVLTSSILNQVTGRNLYFKCELFQKTGSFKVTIPFDSVACIFSIPFHILNLLDSPDYSVR